MAADTSGDRPDLEAALLSEHWQPVLCYADLCTISAEEAVQLASEAFARTLREAPPWSAPHFAWLPRLLIGVRNTAADWQAEGNADLLAPGLRVWLQAEEGPSTALHGFQDMPEPDKSLLWHSEIECRPPAESAAALGVSTDRAEEEIVRTRELFRESCLRARMHTLADKECRGYAKLLDVATREPEAPYPADLRGHLDRCRDCAATAKDFALHSGRLPYTLAEGVLGWAGAAYLDRRRAVSTAPPGPIATPRPARRRAALTAAALAVPALVLVAVLVPSSGAPTSAAGSRAPVPATTTAPDLPVVPSTASPSPSPSPSSSRPPAGDVANGATRLTAVPSPTPSKTTPPPASKTPASCTASYRLVSQWDGGFQAEVRITSRTALNGWRVEWSYPDGQRITQMWDGNVTQWGPDVTATQADYNASIPAHQPLVFGFLGTWYSSNTGPSSLTLNGATCDG
jgi:DNA-directed RNA polymerase specialized sigma24 family protein